MSIYCHWTAFCELLCSSKGGAYWSEGRLL